MENYEQHGYVALGGIQRRVEQRLDAMTVTTGSCRSRLSHENGELIETSMGISPPAC